MVGDNDTGETAITSGDYLQSNNRSKYLVKTDPNRTERFLQNFK